MSHDEMTAEMIDGLLHEQYGEDPWVYISQLREGTGYTRRRTIDAFAVHVWPSKFRALAMEIKVTRSDFLRDIRDPSKRQPFVENSTGFYYVVPQGLIEPDEVPEGCGLMYAQRGRVIRKKIAQERELERFEPLFVASLVRRMQTPHPYRHTNLFKYAGEELTRGELAEVVEDLVEEEVEARRQAWREEIHEGLNGWDNLREIVAAGRWLTGNARDLGVERPLTTEGLEAWKERGGMKIAPEVEKPVRALVQRIERREQQARLDAEAAQGLLQQILEAMQKETPTTEG